MLLSTLFVIIIGFFCYVSFELSIASNFFEKYDIIKKYNILHSMWYITIFLILFIFLFCYIVFLLIRERFRMKIELTKDDIIKIVYPCSAAKYFSVDNKSYLYQQMIDSSENIINLTKIK
jgi:hypothetical protein